MTNPNSKPQGNIFDLIVQMPQQRDFALAMCQHLGHLDHPVVRVFKTKLDQAIHRQAREASCGTVAPSDHFMEQVPLEPSPRQGRRDPRLDALHQQEEALREELRREQFEESEKRAQLLAEAASGTLEALEQGWLTDYEAFRLEGLSHRDAIREIHRGTGRPGKVGTAIDSLLIEGGISAARGRRTTERRAERDAEILRLATSGMKPRAIAARLGTTVATVKGVLAKRRRTNPGAGGGADQNR